MYLKQRYRKWWAFHDIPPSLQAQMGTKRLAQSLGVEDRQKAERLAMLLWAHDWSKQIDRAKTGRDKAKPDSEAAFLRRLVLQAKDPDERELLEDHIADMARERAYKAAERAGVSPEDEEAFKALPEVQETIRFAQEAMGKITPTADHLSDWLAVTKGTPRTLDMKRKAVEDLAARFPFLPDVDAPKVQAWVYDLAKVDGLARKTIALKVSFLRVYWEYLTRAGIVEKGVKPFDDLDIPELAKREKRKAFTPEEVVSLLKAAEGRGDHTLADLIRLGMWTGGRIEALCSLRVSEVHGDWFEILDDKTEAGKRKVPIHSKLKPIMDRLVANSADGFVLSGLQASKYGDRSAAIGKRFGRLKKDQGFGEAHVFHSIRKTFITILENAGAPENLVADIVGHDKPRITYGLYSGGSVVETLRPIVELVSYPEG